MTARFRDQSLASMAPGDGLPTFVGRALAKFLRLGRTIPPLRPGDRFRKVQDRFDRVWEVARIWTTVDGLVHVRLKCRDGQGETRIVSAVTLTDSTFFCPVAAPRAPD